MTIILYPDLCIDDIKVLIKINVYIKHNLLLQNTIYNILNNVALAYTNICRRDTKTMFDITYYQKSF